MRYILFILMFSSGLFAQGIEPSSLQPTPYQGGILKGVTPYVDPFSGETRYIYQHDTIVFNPDSIYLKTATGHDPDTIYLRDGSGFALLPKSGSGSGGGGGGTLKGTGTPTQVAYFAASDSLASDSDMYFDAVNKRVGIGTTTPTANVHIQGDGNTSATSSLLVEDSGNTTLLNVRNDGQLQVKTTNVANPAYSFFDAPTTGFYHFGGGTFGVVSQAQYTTLISPSSHKFYANAAVNISNPNLQLNAFGSPDDKLSIWRNSNGDFQFEAWRGGVGYDKHLLFNPIAGFVGIRNTNPQRTLHVTGEARITDLVTDTPTRIVGADADGDLGELKVGNGLTISNDSLIVTVSGGGDDWGTQVVESDLTLLGDGTSGNLLKVDTSIIATQHDLTTINTDNQNLSHTVSGTDRTINISGGTGTTISVADNDNDSSNELNTSLTVSHAAGNVLPRVRITDAGGTLEGLVPFFSTSNFNAGVVPGSNGASNSNFLRADGIWATPVSSGMTNWNLGINNGSYTAVGDGANVSLNAGTNITLSKSGNIITMNATNPQTWELIGGDIISWGSTGSSNSGRYVGIGTLSPLSVFHVNGNSTLAGVLYNSSNSAGSSGQVLTSQGSGTPWTWTTISSTDDQNLSYGTKSGNRIPLDIQDGVGVNFDQSWGITLDRTSSNVMTVRKAAPYVLMGGGAVSETLNSSTWTKVFVNGSTAYNGDGVNADFDNANEWIDINVTGTYKIEMSCNCKSNTSGHTVTFSARRASGATSVSTESKHYYNNTNEYSHATSTWIQSLSAGDNVGVYAITSTGTPNINDCTVRLYIERLE